MMKKAVIFTTLLLAAACAPKDGIRTFRIREGQEADLGKIKEIDGPVTVRLVIQNDYPDTLYPVQLNTSCGCTKAHFDRVPVAPGADETLEVTYNPAYRPGPMQEEVQVRYQDSPVRLRSFVIKGRVSGYNHPIEEDRPYPFGEGLYMSHKVLSYGSLPFKPYVRMRQPGRMKADQRDTLHVKFRMPDGVDSLEFAIQPRVDGKPTQEVLTVRAFRK